MWLQIYQQLFDYCKYNYYFYNYCKYNNSNQLTLPQPVVKHFICYPKELKYTTPKGDCKSPTQLRRIANPPKRSINTAGIDPRLPTDLRWDDMPA